MTARRWTMVLSLAGALLLPGCGANEETKDGLKKAEIEPATTLKSVYRDFESVTLQNGLVQVAVVPQIGGRVLGYEFSGRDLLYANPRLLGQLPGEGGQPPPPVGAGHPQRQQPGSRSVADCRYPGPAGGHRRRTLVPRTPAGERQEIEDVPGGGEHVADGPLAPADEAGAESDNTVGAAAAGEVMDVAAEEPATTSTIDVAADADPVTYLPSQTAQDYPNYGGQVSWPLPRANWPQAWPPPVPVDLGGYTVELPEHGGDAAEVVVTSPADEELKVQLSKTVLLPRASTVVQVTTRLQNLDVRARTWSLADISQHPGALTPGETFTRDVQLVLPLQPDSQRHLGYTTLLGSQTNPQLFPADGRMRIDYLGQESMIGTDSRAGWCAYADARHELVMVKLAVVEGGGHYPDGNTLCTAYTAPAEAESYVQLDLRSALRAIKPQESLEFTVWYGAANCPLPILDATRAGGGQHIAEGRADGRLGPGHRRLRRVLHRLRADRVSRCRRA
ncbi:MAG: DUF4380 domain-containing protein [Gammaproteobacteria bacterium]|nr:DUF4380 domain-containing protein [Gammaproteobacteria bacterium]